MARSSVLSPSESDWRKGQQRRKEGSAKSITKESLAQQLLLSRLKFNHLKPKTRLLTTSKSLWTSLKELSTTAHRKCRKSSEGMCVLSLSWWQEQQYTKIEVGSVIPPSAWSLVGMYPVRPRPPPRPPGSTRRDVNDRLLM
eukprot:1160285-Pelagomonas_calceolata.AAC.5